MGVAPFETHWIKPSLAPLILFSALRKKGRPVPTNDLWIAASALQHGYAVFSFDKHFGEMENLIVGSQLDDFLP